MSTPIKLKSYFPQPCIAFALAGLAIFTLGAAWSTQGIVAILPSHIALAGGLAIAVVAAYQFPIQVGFRHQIEMTTIPFYLMAVLLPTAALAATTAGVALAVAELLARPRRGNSY